jgi:hypothetical protein
MSVIIAIAAFQDAVATNHALIASGNYAITNMEITLSTVEGTAAAQIGVELYLQYGVASQFYLKNFYYPGVAPLTFYPLNISSNFTFPSPLLIPRASALSCGSANYLNLSSVIYSVAIYGDILP